MEQLTVFDWFVFKCLPFGREEAIFEIDLCGAYYVIAEDKIVVHSIDLDRWTTREDCFEIVAFEEAGVGFIFDVMVTFVVFLTTTRDYQIGIREASVIA